MYQLTIVIAMLYNKTNRKDLFLDHVSSVKLGFANLRSVCLRLAPTYTLGPDFQHVSLIFIGPMVP